MLLKISAKEPMALHQNWNLYTMIMSWFTLLNYSFLKVTWKPLLTLT